MDFFRFILFVRKSINKARLSRLFLPFPANLNTRKSPSDEKSLVVSSADGSIHHAAGLGRLKHFNVIRHTDYGLKRGSKGCQRMLEV
jgi:hypothetical protein